MNPKYYTTPEQTQQVVEYLNQHGIGGGVIGLELEEWAGPFALPKVEGKDVVNVRLASGTRLNAGLTLDLIQRYGAANWITRAMLEAMARPAGPS